MRIGSPWSSGTALGVVAALGLVAQAGGATFVVDIFTDDPDSVIDGNCAGGPGGCSLRAAIQEANAQPGPDRIELPAGTFELTIAGADEDAAASADLDVLDDLEIEGVGAGTTIVDGADLDRVLDVPFGAPNPDLTLRDLTLRNGRVVDAGGGIVRFDSSGTLTLDRVAVEDGEVLGVTCCDPVGGGVDSTGIGDLVLRASSIRGSSADRGGGLFSNGSLTIEDSTLADNQARAGSAVLSFGDTSIDGTTVSGNEATGNDTVVLDGSGTYSVENSTFSGNIDSGGGVVYAVNGALSVQNVTLFSNPTRFAVQAFDAAIELSHTVTVSSGPSFEQECETIGAGSITSLGHNLDSDGTCATGASNDQPSTAPLFGPLSDNGGPTRTHFPLTASPLRDTGSPTACPPMDQRGEPRPTDGDGDMIAACDIGAVEAVPEPSAMALGVAAAVVAAALAGRSRVGRLRLAIGSDRAAPQQEELLDRVNDEIDDAWTSLAVI